MRRLSDGSAMSEARRFKTLTLGRAVGGGVGGVAMPQATAQNQMIIADATPVWSLLAAPAAEYQILIAGADPYVPVWAALTVGTISDLDYATPALTLSTVNAEGSADTVIRTDATVLVFDATVADIIQPDDAAAAGSASVAARRDHTHGIVCAAPASPSVSLAASAEGTGTSFARDDHAHQLDQAIAPTWTALHTFNAGITFGGATGVNVITVPDNLAQAMHVVDAGGIEYLRIVSTDAQPGLRANPGTIDVDFQVRASGIANALFVRGSDAYVGLNVEDPLTPFHVHGEVTLNTGITFSGTVPTPYVKIPDNAAIALRLIDAGTLEYMRVISTDAQPVVVFNEGGADVDFRVEASGQANALFVQGSDGDIGMGTPTPAGTVHLYRTANSQCRLIVDAQGSSDVQAAVLDLMTLGDGTKAIGDAATKGWHFTARGNAYTASAEQNNLYIIYWTGSTYEYVLRVDHTNSVYVEESSAWTRLSGTKEFGWIISGPIVETYGQIRIPWACTVTRVDANTVDGTSCTFNIEERSTLGSAGTDILSSDMVADANGESVTSSFNNSSLAEGNYLAIDVSAVSGAVSFVSIMVTVTLT